MKTYRIEYWEKTKMSVKTLKQAKKEIKETENFYGDKVKDFKIIEVESVEKEID